MDARDFNFIAGSQDSFTDDKFRFEAFVNKRELC